MRFVGAIKREIETNRRLLADFGPLKPDRPPPLRWNNRQLYCRRTKNVREPSVRALSFLGSCTGLRSDLTILDDPIDKRLWISPAGALDVDGTLVNDVRGEQAEEEPYRALDVALPE